MTYITGGGSNDPRIKSLSSATLVGGTVTVASALATSTAKIFLCARTGTINLGSVSVSAINAGVDFTILSTNVLDTRVVDIIIFEP